MIEKIGFILLFCFFPLAVFVGGCTEVQDSAGKVLGNANSVIKTGKEKAWVEPEVTPVRERY